MHWKYTGSNLKSNWEINKLVNNVILAPDFDPSNLTDFSITRKEKCLDAGVLSEDGLAAEG